MGKILPLLAALLLGSLTAQAQICDNAAFIKPFHTVDSLFKIRTGTTAKLHVVKVMKTRRGTLDIHFGESLADFPVRKEDLAWLKATIKDNLPEEYSRYGIGNLYVNSRPADCLVVPRIDNDGTAPASKKRTADRKGPVLVDRGIKAPLGLEGRHIALWQSHGRYYHLPTGTWKWQRACIFQIVEDLSTQSYIVPFLVPMLENAGANVFLPRERDYHTRELVIDNDPCESESCRIHGHMEFKGKWTSLDKGFADAYPTYQGLCNPFELGSSLWCKSFPDCKSSATWYGNVPERGEYAVYVSYVSLPNSSRRAAYTVHGAGADHTVYVNQRIGGGQWVYIGTYDFDKGETPLVSLSGRTDDRGVVVADAVRIGGGMGNVARGNDSTAFATSGMPRFAEGARYYLQWSGAPHKVWSQNDEKDDYRDDLMCRGMWVQNLCGGSRFAPKAKGLGIPVDLSMAFHTDAGTRKDDSIVGTLAIYTRLCEGSSKFANNESRDRCRELTDIMQTQVVDDIRAVCDTAWTRRMLWNRSYSESRTTGVPAVLLELLSHQNFEDMKYGLDPQFRFLVSRSCYKAMLKFLSLRYGCPYVVQPLPVERFSALLDEESGNVTLSWTERVDSLEATAHPDSYTVYRRIDSGGWDNGRTVSGCSAIDKVEPGHIYSYKVVASNKGGLSFPSEILSVGIAPQSKGKVLIVNNFNRVSGPTWFDQESYAGFDNRNDSGVPYLRDWSFIGEQFEFRRYGEYKSDDNCGFGSSYEDYADKVIAGNSFDYPYVHGLSVMKAGFSFESSSSAAFASDAKIGSGCIVADIICGKQCRVRTANRTPVREGIFPEGMRSALRRIAEQGCNILVSGSYIGSDSFSSIFPIDTASIPDLQEEQAFIRDILGYSFQRQHATRTGKVSHKTMALSGIAHSPEISFPISPCSRSYSVENCDALYPSGLGAQIFLIYSDTSLPAAIIKDFCTRRTAAFAFPLETINEADGRDSIIKDILTYLTQR